MAAIRLYSCKIYDNGTLVRDYIPCKLQDGSIGLYDKLNNKFYANKGTGEFIAGPQAKWKQLEYIESNGT
jgi:hypothetical protein